MASKQQTKPASVDPFQDLQQTIQNTIQKGFKEFEEKMQKNLNKQTDEFEQKIEEITGAVQQQHEALREDIIFAVQGVLKLVKDVEQSNAQLESRVDEVEMKGDKSDAEIVMIQYRAMEGAIRIRGLKEQEGEDLRQVIVEALEKCLGKEEDWQWNIDKIYRVNSWIARQKKLPRDVVIYFVTRRARNRIVQHSYQNKLYVLGQEVIVLKELPPKMLRARKDYSFLITELRRRLIQYRWDLPYGMIVIYKGKRHRLNTPRMAKDFYDELLKSDQEQTTDYMKEIAQEGAMAIQEDPNQPTEERIVLREIRRPSPQEQRQTRAAVRRKEQEIKQPLMTYAQAVNGSKAVGGARPKMTSGDLEAMLLKLSGKGDGN